MYIPSLILGAGRRISRRRLSSASRALIYVATVTILATAFKSLAQPSVPRASEQTIKAAFLYKFAEYVDWPESVDTLSGGPFTIAVLGSGTLADDLARMTVDRTVNKRPIRVRALATDEVIDDVQMLFITNDQRDKLAALLAPIRSRPILTVTESKGAIEEGSVINFTISGDRVRFEISLDAADSHRLHLSSRLLAVAEHVYQTR
jgi:YfiR/HmsC-like